MRKLVKINADGVRSRYGYIVEGDDCAAVVKVPYRSDWMECLEIEHCTLLGRDLLEEVTPA